MRHFSGLYFFGQLKLLLLSQIMLEIRMTLTARKEGGIEM
jgi:hypothetical protein